MTAGSSLGDRSDPPVEREPPVEFGVDGLVPVVVQDATNGDVLMVAFMNAEALAATRATGLTHFWSRSRGRLWRKGETSGNEQSVESIHLNCDRNSLLISVRQTGAVCHDGYPTCFYHRLEADNSLLVDRERAFDPADVYASAGAVPVLPHLPDTGTAVGDELREKSWRQFRTYAYLRDHDHGEASATSRRLRTEDTVAHASRLADELRELAGALDGTHRHLDPTADVMLEAGQSIYWTLLVALGADVTWGTLRPDRALATTDADLRPGSVAALLRADAERWAASIGTGVVAARCHATLALIGQGCRSGGVSVEAVLDADLAALREKSYLAAFFAGLDGGGDGFVPDTDPSGLSEPPDSVKAAHQNGAVR